MIFSRDYIEYLARRTVKHLMDAKMITTSDMKVTQGASTLPSSMSFRSKTASTTKCA